MTFPPSYKAFLGRFGAMSFIDVTISGILDNGRDQDGGYVVTDTKRFRTEWRLPNHYVVIQPNYQAPYCLDTRKRDAAGECPAVCYELVPARDSGDPGNCALPAELLRRFDLANGAAPDQAAAATLDMR